MTPATAAAAGRRLGISPSLRRLAVFVAVVLSEMLAVSVLFSFSRYNIPYWQDPAAFAHDIARLAVPMVPLFVLIAWPRRQELLAALDATARHSSLWPWVALNALMFCALLTARFLLWHMGQPPTAALAVYGVILLATGLSLAPLAAPIEFWRRLPRMARTEIALTVIGGCLIFASSRLAQEGWSTLSSATLTLSHWFLTLYEHNVHLDQAQKLLGVGDFKVLINAPCSGYEGAGLIVAFLAIYLWVFRHDLRFPNALLMVPIGIAVIWILNSLRIALLVSIGAHVSPELAVEGFHSQAGWISFLLVTLGCIALSRRMPFFALARGGRATLVDHGSAAAGTSITLAYLAPFMALMAASIVAALFVPHDKWLYSLKVAAIVAALWWFRGAYASLLAPVSPVSVIAGLAVGVAWIATDPGQGAQSELGAWLAALPAGLAAFWIALRLIGSIVLIPVAEELAFRGYLYRVLINAKFEAVRFDEFRWLALIGSSVAFGLMHERWLAGLLTGVVYALLMYRSNRLSDPVAAHMASNAAIGLWAVAAGQWTLL